VSDVWWMNERSFSSALWITPQVQPRRAPAMSGPCYVAFRASNDGRMLGRDSDTAYCALLVIREKASNEGPGSARRRRSPSCPARRQSRPDRISERSKQIDPNDPERTFFRPISSSPAPDSGPYSSQPPGGSFSMKWEDLALVARIPALASPPAFGRTELAPAIDL
jgi:hypothetical protein